MTKKQITKDDGRTLIYYHAPQTATAQQTQVFEEIEAKEETVSLGNAAISPAKETLTDV